MPSAAQHPRAIRGTTLILGGSGRRHAPLKLAGCPQLLVESSAGQGATNIGGGTLTGRRVGSGGDRYPQLRVVAFHPSDLFDAISQTS